MKIRYQLALGFIIVVLLQVVITAVGAWRDDKIIPVIAVKDTAKTISEKLMGRNHVALAEGASPETEMPS